MECFNRRPCWGVGWGVILFADRETGFKMVHASHYVDDTIAHIFYTILNVSNTHTQSSNSYP